MTLPGSDALPVYVVFGATGGIGECLCRRLAARGARLILAARNVEKLHSLARQLDATAHPLDATHFEEVEACLEKTLQQHGRVDGVACCVGSLLLKSAQQTTEAEWLATIATNLTTAFAVVRAGARAMASTGGSIVLVSSAAARIGITSHEAIAAAKAGVIGLTLSAAATGAGRGIRVNCVAPGLVRTPMTARLTGPRVQGPNVPEGNGGTVLRASQAMHPLGRIGEPEDVALALEWLLNPEQSWVTGQVLGIDGGLASVRSR